MKYLTNLDLTKNELQNAVIQNLAVAPSSPKVGQIYYNTTDQIMYQYKKVSSSPDTYDWVTVGKQGTVTNVGTGSGLTGGPITSSGTISLDTAYGDTINPYGGKVKNTVLAGPDGSEGHTDNAVPTFRALVEADMPNSYLPLSGGIMTGNIDMNGNTITGLGDPGDDTSAATSKDYVDTAITTAISGVADPMVFKGTVGTSGTIEWSNLPLASSSNTGYTYKVITKHTSAPICEVGDTIISDGTSWVVIPSGDEPSGTVTSVAVSSPLTTNVNSGDPITSSGTISLANYYGDTKNPYDVKYPHYVLAGPASGTSTASPTFRALVAADLPSHKLTFTNPALSASGGAWTWTIPDSSNTLGADVSVTIYEASTGAIVIPDIVVNQSTGAITITINDTASASSLTAGTYKAVVLG